MFFWEAVPALSMMTHCCSLHWCRRTAKAAATKASQQAGGGSYLHEQPEWVLPFAIQVLAHHPEFPQQQDLDAGAAEALEPFLKMLQFTLEPLLLPLPGLPDASGDHQIS